MRQPHVFQQEQWVPKPLRQVFPFFSDAHNLETLTPAWLRFEVMTPGPIEIRTGTRIHYRLKWHGIPIWWTTQITAWNPPFGFEDVQLSGPYQLWQHTHRFEEAGGHTRMIDVVRYALPLGPLGRIVHAISVRKNIEGIFEYRRAKVEELFGAASAPRS